MSTSSPNRPIDPRDQHLLEQELTQQKQNLERAIREGPLAVWHAQRGQQLARLFSLAEELARAEVNRTALGFL